MMGHTKVSSLLNATLQEEEQTNNKLTDLAQSSINRSAMDERKS
jgi:ferritin-like metal-binding protein YciE